ncbi:aromatic acid exporter family protein [Amphibacillus sp. Q70]|uniref:aromatic acid exporter family protein n=1 Tax=Amphibacillus sp. Q70 TaxID=3453416 RepID=UPI003F838FA4
MKISYQTFKMIIAVPIAVLIAEWLELNHPGSAGIIAVLCIQSTRKQSFLIAWHRLSAGLLSIVFAYFIFEYLGYHPWTVGLLLLLFIPVAHLLKIAPGIVTSLVVLFHFYGARSVNGAIIINEIAIMAIGIGVALILNLYMPSLDRKLTKLKNDIEANYQLMFRDFSAYLKGEKREIPTRHFTELKTQLYDAEEWVQKNIENTFSRNAYRQQQYFSMRKVQLDSLEQMLRLIQPLEVTVEQSHKIADLFTDLADAIYPNNAVLYHLDQVQWLKGYFAKDQLPKSRQEFEIRAHLFQLLYEIEHYLKIKNRAVTEKCA